MIYTYRLKRKAAACALRPMDCDTARCFLVGSGEGLGPPVKTVSAAVRIDDAGV